MLIRLSLIVAIIAGLAVAALNFITVKEKIVTLQTNLASETKQKEEAQRDLSKTRRDLDTANKDLTQTKEALATTTEEKNQAQAQVAQATETARRTAEELDKTKTELNGVQADLQAYRSSGLTPQQVIALNNSFKEAQAALAGAQSENQLLGRKINRLQAQLDIFIIPDGPPPITLPARLQGKVVQSDPKWNFVVLNIGENQEVVERAELLVSRNGQFVAKIRVQSVQKDQCVGNVMPGWQVGEIMEGDVVIPAHPQS